MSAIQDVKANPTNRALVLKAVAKDGWALQYAADNLRADREVVLAALKQNPGVIKLSMGGLAQDPAVLKTAGLSVDIAPEGAPWIVLSVRFSLAGNNAETGNNSAAATNLYRALTKAQEAPDRGNAPRPVAADHHIYFPNAFCKGFCTPITDNQWWKFTSMKCACFGMCGPKCSDFECRNKACQNSDHWCWQYSFRRQLERAAATRGIMLQLVENPQNDVPTLGDGQKIEVKMAEQVGCRVEVVHYDQYWDEDDSDTDNGRPRSQLAAGSTLVQPNTDDWAIRTESRRLRAQLGRILGFKP